MRQVFVLLLLFAPMFVLANTFTVVSNADAGAGTLRDVVSLAQANGANAYDTILFNIPDQSAAGRTIFLNTTLTLSSKLIIDGSSQSGVKFGVSDAKIKLVCKDSIDFTFIKLSNSNNVHIYGLYISGKNISSYMSFDRTVTGVDFKNCDSVYLGAAGKGNYLNGLRYGFFSDYDSSRYVVIRSNVLGLNDAGDVDPSYDRRKYNATSIYFQNVRDIVIGGPSAADRNYITGSEAFSISSTKQYNNGYVRMENNYIHVSYSGLKSLFNITSVYSCEIRAGNVPFKVDFEVRLKNNVLTHVSLFMISKPFLVQGNRFGVQANTEAELTGTATSFQLTIAFCEEGLVGGENEIEKNIFAYGTAGVGVLGTYKVHIKKNSMYCHGLKGIVNNWTTSNPDRPTMPPMPFIYVNSIVSNTYSGTAPPNAKIEVFTADAECLGCEGKTYIGKTTSDNNGKWTYTPSTTSSLVFTATNKDSATSEFSRAEVNERNVVVNPSTCGKNNGSITGLKIISGTGIKWMNNKGEVVGTDTSIYNLPPGNYYYMLSIGDNNCIYRHDYVIDNFVPVQNIATTIYPASCGKNNGSITGDFYVGNGLTGYGWFTNTGDTITTQPSIFDVAPGKYWFKSWLKNDTSCNKTFGPFEIINKSGSSLNVNNARVTNAVCNKNNGSIKNIQIENPSGNPYFSWHDSAGAVIAHTLDIDRLPAGKYRLRFKDGSGCDTITSAWFVVKNEGLIFLDASAVSIQAADCNSNNGSITGLRANGATSYQWIASSGGNTAGSNISLENAAAGNYQLILNNSFNCETKSALFVVPPASFMTISVNAFQLKNAGCEKNNGSISAFQFSANSALYNFRWIDSSAASVVSTDLNINNLSPSTYQLFAKDTNNCESKIFSAKIVQTGKPVINFSGVSVKNDVCNEGTGQISGLTASGGAGAPFQWQWFNTANRQVAGTSVFLNATSGSYYAVVTDASQCADTSSSFAIANQDELLVSPLLDDRNILRGTTAGLVVKNVHPYKYLLFDTIPAIAPYSSGTSGILTTNAVLFDKTFYVQAVKGTCAGSIVPVQVKVFDETRIVAANAFSPNGDGINDVWKINIEGLVYIGSFSIYNRWGDLVYTTRHLPLQWDGSSNGKIAAVGTYYYILVVKDRFDKSINKSGSVFLVK
jgi:gliding motility-associated-like protein